MKRKKTDHDLRFFFFSHACEMLNIPSVFLSEDFRVKGDDALKMRPFFQVTSLCPYEMLAKLSALRQVSKGGSLRSKVGT